VSEVNQSKSVSPESKSALKL